MPKDISSNRTQQQLPSPQELREELPASSSVLTFIDEARNTVKNILDGKDPRLLLIVGPCSIHDITAAKEYALKLKSLSDEVEENFFLLMRTYFEKPRTTVGWKGLLFDPYLNRTHDIHTGMRWTRQLLLDLAELGVPAAAEFLDPTSTYYFGDLITWGCIGARTAESQTHREIASGLPMPVGFKNNTDGNAQIAVNGALSASQPHTYIGINQKGKTAITHTEGNDYCHVVLRGGDKITNYDPKSISTALASLEAAGLKQRLIIDCSHDNSNKQHQQQIIVFKSVISQILEGNNAITGMILESNLLAGCQKHTLDAKQLEYGVSLTDPCLDWDITEKLLLWGASKLNANNDELEEELTSPLHATHTLSH